MKFVELGPQQGETIKTPTPAYNRGMFVKEFDQWSHRSGSHRGEDFVIKNFLDKKKRTLEAGCGGGRLLLVLQSLGFTDLHGFDYLPEFIDVAHERDASGTIDYRVMDATQLDYANDSFDQLMYLQQVLCFLGSIADQQRAVCEAFRVLRPGGVLVACVLAERSRLQFRLPRLALRYISILRTITFRRRSTQFLPWLRSNRKPNYKALFDLGPYIYWFREGELVGLFKDAGFRIVAIGTDAQVAAGQFFETVDDLITAPFRGGLYLVCQKPCA